MRIFSVFVVVLAAACGGGDGDSPTAKCNAFLDVTCDRAIECNLPDVGAHGECVAMLATVVPCEDAKSVSASYGACMNEMESSSCAVLFPTDPGTGEPGLELPASCNAVVMVREGVPASDEAPRSWMETATSSVE